MLSDNYKYIAKSDIIVIAVPTPLTANLSPDLSYIKKAIISINAKHFYFLVFCSEKQIERVLFGK